jgi:hypothetical protein
MVLSLKLDLILFTICANIERRSFLPNSPLSFSNFYHHFISLLQLTEADLRAPWEFEPAPTKLQRFGDAVARQQRFGAVRFPSDAARTRGFKGFNIVLFPSAIVAPMSVVIRDDPGVEIQRWPSP